MTWGTELAAWRKHLISAGTATETIKLRIYHLERVAAELKGRPDTVTLERLVDWLAAQEWAPNTRRTYRASLRSFYSWALVTGRVKSSPAHLLPSVKVPRARPRPTPETVYRDALATADERVTLALLLGGQYGLRRGEISRARREDVEPDLIGSCLRVVGKGGHVRLVPLEEEHAALILRRPAGWLFPSPVRPGHPLTPAHLGKLVRQALETHTTHTLRHRAGTKSYRATLDIRAVQEFLGHASPAPTAIYTEVGRDAIRAAMRGAA